MDAPAAVAAPFVVLTALKLTVGLEALDMLHIVLLQALVLVLAQLQKIQGELAALRAGPAAPAPAPEAPAAAAQPAMSPEHPLAVRARACVERFTREYAPEGRVPGGGARADALGSEAWPAFLQTEHGAAHRKAGAKLCFRLSQTLPATPAAVLALLLDTGRRTEWDRTCEQIEVLERLDAHTAVVYYRTKRQWPTSARDLVMLSHTHELPGGAGFLRVNTSMEHPARPPQSGCVRAHCDLAGELLLAAPGGGCELVQIQNVDPKGLLPESVVTVALKDAQASTLRRLAGLAPSLREPEGAPGAVPVAPPVISPVISPGVAVAKRRPQWLELLQKGSPALAALFALLLLRLVRSRMRR